MSVLEVACVVEGSYVPHTAAMLHSVLAHAGGPVHVHYLHGPGHPERPARRLERWLRAQGAEVTFHRVPDERTAGLPTTGFTGHATWYRIFLPDLLADRERVLFLDADLVVCDALGPLWETDLGGACLGAVTNVFEPEYAHRPAELGLASTHDYFNAGVLLLDLAALRRDGCSQALYDYGVAHAGDDERSLLFRDQDVLNAVLAGRRHRLDPRWNVMNIFRFDWADEVFGAEAVAEARRDPGIRHFEGPADNKPWHAGCEREGRERYFEHRRATPWPRVRLEGPRGLRARRLARRVARRLR